MRGAPRRHISNTRAIRHLAGCHYGNILSTLYVNAADAFWYVPSWVRDTVEEAMMWRQRLHACARTTMTNSCGRTLSVFLLVGMVGMSGCHSLSQASSAPTVTVQAVPTPTTAPIPTPVAPTAATLHWSAERLPADTLTKASADSSTPQMPVIVPAQSDSAMAYLCALPSDRSSDRVGTWLTHDHGAHWQAAAAINVDVGFPVEFADCQIVVDTTQPRTAVIQ